MCADSIYGYASAKAAAKKELLNMTAMASSREHKPKAAIIGGSIAGLMSGLVLHDNNFDVVLYEKEEKYVRSIQWTVRQSFINYLYSVDNTIGEYLQSDLISSISNGYRYLSDKTQRYPKGAYMHLRREASESPKSSELTQKSCADSLDDDSVGIVRAKELEAYLFQQLGRKSHTELLRPQKAPKCVRLADGRYALENGTEEPTPYDLIVVCVGAGRSRSEIFKMIDYKPLGRERAQVSGDIKLERQGMVIQYQHAKVDKERLKNLPSGELLFSALLSRDDETTTCWVVGDVSTEFLDLYTKESDAENANLMADLARTECGKIAARTMLETDEGVLEAGIDGVFSKTVNMFSSQAKLSTTAYAGSNLILAGDAVGAGHWAVGGGMHVAGMCHQKRLNTLASKWHYTKDQKDWQLALEEYSEGVLEDTKAWISRSMQYYYLSIPKEVVDAVYEEVLEAFKKDSTIDAPNEMRERIVSVYFGPKSDTPAKDAGIANSP